MNNQAKNPTGQNNGYSLLVGKNIPRAELYIPSDVDIIK
jgi:hypothetical protein